MPEKFKMTYTVSVAGGPTISENQSADLEACDWIKVAVPKGAKDLEVVVQPGDKGQVQVFVVTASAYKPGLSYSLNQAEGDATKRKKLDTALLLLGEGAVSVLGDAPKKVYLYNDTNEDIEVQILVGRRAVVPQPQPNTPQGNTPQGGNQPGNNPQGNAPQGNTPQGNTPQSNTPQGNNPPGNFPQGNNPQGGNPQGSNPQGGNPQSSYPSGGQ